MEKRLIELGSYFGALPVHNGLWESADTTKDNFLARLAIVHMVHEARLTAITCYFIICVLKKNILLEV